MIRGMEPLSYEYRLRAGVAQPGKDKVQGHFIAPSSTLKGAYKRAERDLFTRVSGDGTRGQWLESERKQVSIPYQEKNPSL